MRARLMVCALVLGACLAQQAHGQTVRGTVSEQTTGRVLPGAVVLLIGAGQSVVARDLTDEQGDFRLRAPGAGSYHVRVLRIGFRPVTSELLTLGSDQELTLPMVVANLPIKLDTFRVVRRNTCDVPPSAAGPAHSAWSQVATALTAAQLSANARRSMTTIVGYERILHPLSEVVIRQGGTVHSGFAAQPWRSTSPDSLHLQGFVRTGADGWLRFEAPDLNVLLSDYFLEDHCLRLDHGGADDEIGIEFWPASDRRHVQEIRGHVWLAKSSLELRRIEYRYVQGPRAYQDAKAGGRIEFLKLRNGTWIISRWHIRIPSGMQRRTRGSLHSLSSGDDIEITQLKITGGELLVVTQGRDTLWKQPLRTLRGTVRDSVGGQRLRDARVKIVGTGHSTRTDDEGEFVLGPVLAGLYTLEVRTDDLDSLAVIHETPLAFTNLEETVDILVPSFRNLTRQFCPALTRNDRNVTAMGPVGMLVGVVRRAGDSVGIRNVTVAAQWREFDAQKLGENLAIKSDIKQLSERTDPRGVYRICGVPANTALAITTELDTLSSTPVRIISESHVARVDVFVAVRPVAAPRDTVPVPAPAAATTVAVMPTVPVTAPAPRPVLPEFEERRLLGVGHFITRDQLAKQENSRTGDILAKVPGVRVNRGTSGGAGWISSTRGTISVTQTPTGDAMDFRRGARPRCYVNVYLDGANVYAGSGTLFDVNSIPPHQIDAIEFYSGSARLPAKYNRTGSACGALIIWTRR